MENLLEGLYYEMVLAPFYQDFMKSLDEHINELVEGMAGFSAFLPLQSESMVNPKISKMLQNDENAPVSDQRPEVSKAP